jgi:hypothetical protein
MLDWIANPPRNVLPTVEGEGLTIEQLGTPFLNWVVDPRSGTVIPAPVEEQEDQEAGEEAPAEDWEILAIAVLVKHPEWTVQQVAEHVGVHRGTLYRGRRLKAFRDRIRAAGKQDFLADLPRGSREVDPDNKRAGARVEAWCERDDDE